MIKCITPPVVCVSVCVCVQIRWERVSEERLYGNWRALLSNYSVFVIYKGGLESRARLIGLPFNCH